MTIVGEFQTSMRRALDEIDPHWESYEGLIACGSHNVDDAERIINLIRIARETDTPFLGICFGHQLAVIEYARNVLGIKDATSEEIGEGTHVVKKLPNLNIGLKDGESYWNNFEVVIDWKKPDNFKTYQFHPEYNSSIFKPHPALVEFLEICKSE